MPLAPWVGGAGVIVPARCGFKRHCFWVGHTTGTAPVVVTETPPAPSPGGVGRSAWRDHYHKPIRKKRRTLLEELDDQLLALRERVEEQDASQQNEDVLRLGEEILASKQAQEISLIALRHQIEMVREAIQEMDDEEVLLLSVH